MWEISRSRRFGKEAEGAGKTLDDCTEAKNMNGIDGNA